MEYMVSEKTDGVRHLMLITRDDKNVYSLLGKYFAHRELF
jgi:hypothetical protein